VPTHQRGLQCRNMKGLRRLAAVLAAAVLLELARRRVRRAWRDRLALADLLTAGPSARERLLRSVPMEARVVLAKEFQKTFCEHGLLRRLYGSRSQKWREVTLKMLFNVLCTLGNDFGSPRFYADAEKPLRENDLGVPVRTHGCIPTPVCFAAVASTKDSKPGLFDVLEAGGLTLYWRLGKNLLLETYQLEKFVLDLRAKSAPKRDYLYIEHFFVGEAYRGKGFAAQMLQEIVQEGEEKSLAFMVVSTEESSTNFFQKQGFTIVGEELYKPLNVVVKVMWRETEASSLNLPVEGVYASKFNSK